MDIDENLVIGEIYGMLRGCIPKTEEISTLLMNGIKNKEKSNRLRERFFWIFSYSFKDECKEFYLKDSEIFLRENSENHQFVGDILNAIYWVYDEQTLPNNIVTLVNEYLQNHKEARKYIHCIFRSKLPPIRDLHPIAYSHASHKRNEIAAHQTSNDAYLHFYNVVKNVVMYQFYFKGKKIMNSRIEIGINLLLCFLFILS